MHLIRLIEWIPVSEKLPEDDEVKLVTCQPKKGNANVNRAYYSGGMWHGSGSMSGVIAWAEIPEPYSGAEATYKELRAVVEDTYKYTE